MVACERKLQSLGIDERYERAGMLVLEREARRVEDRALGSMLLSGDERTTAAADFWLAGQAAFSTLSKAGCDDEACSAHAEETRARGEGAAERLVRKALRSTDPVVYGWAYQSCAAASASAPSCQLINASQWARLSPGNAVAWFAVAEDASRRKDATALDNAMFQIAAADRVDSAFFVLPGLLVQHGLGDGSDAIAAGAVMVAAVGMSAITEPVVSAPLQYCSGIALTDPNRRQTCEQVAELFVARSNTLLVRGMGTGLGKRLGWPEGSMHA